MSSLQPYLNQLSVKSNQRGGRKRWTKKHRQTEARTEGGGHVIRKKTSLFTLSVYILQTMSVVRASQEEAVILGPAELDIPPERAHKSCLFHGTDRSLRVQLSACVETELKGHVNSRARQRLGREKAQQSAPQPGAVFTQSLAGMANTSASSPLLSSLLLLTEQKG
ncbi:hypothetical protein SRHO_G00043240 [Serrasalmus rhombeus]